MNIRVAQEPDVAALHEIVERAYGIYVERIGRRPAPMDDDYAEKLREPTSSSPTTTVRSLASSFSSPHKTTC